MSFNHLSRDQLKTIAQSSYYRDRGWTYVEGKAPEATLYKGGNLGDPGVTTIRAYR